MQEKESQINEVSIWTLRSVWDIFLWLSNKLTG